MKKLISILLALSMIFTTCSIAFSQNATDDYTVAWIGGSFTEGTAGESFVARVDEWMDQTHYAGAETVNTVNAGAGGTTSYYGRVRLEREVLNHNPDLVFIEFAGNDSTNLDQSLTMYGMESMIRTIIANNENTKIAILFRPEWNENTKAKKYHQYIADYYGIPIIDASDACGETPDPGMVSEDGVHPNAAGYAAIAEAIEEWLSENSIPYPIAKVNPIMTNYKPAVNVYKDASEIFNAADTVNNGWELDENGSMVSNNEGDTITFKIKGNTLALISGALGYDTDMAGRITISDALDAELAEEYGVNELIIEEDNLYNIPRDIFKALTLGDGEHIVKIENVSGFDLNIRYVVVDGVAYGEKESIDEVNNTVVIDDMNEMRNVQDYNGLHSPTPQGGVITSPDGGWTIATGDGLNPNNSTGQAAIIYDLSFFGTKHFTYTVPEDNSFGSAHARVLALVGETPLEMADNDWVDLNPDQYVSFTAIDENGAETPLDQLNFVEYVSIDGWVYINYRTSSIPAGTKELRVTVNSSPEAQTVHLNRIEYSYGIPEIESVYVETVNSMFEGETASAKLMGNMSNGAVADLSDYSPMYYTTDSDIITIDSVTGEISAESPGEATIYAQVLIGDKMFEAQANVRVYMATGIDEAYFEVPKTNYTVGTGGKIDFVTVIDGMPSIDAFNVSYESSDPDVVTIDDDGNFTAVSEGTAVITPQAQALPNEFEPITITVHKSNTVVVDIQDDIDSGKLDSDFINDMDNMGGHKHGTELFAWTYYGAFIFGTDYYTHCSGTPGDAMNVGYIYKVDEGLEKVTGDFATWSPGDLEKRTQIAYLVDDTLTFTDEAYPDVEMTLGDERLSSYGVRHAITDTAENGASKLRSDWIDGGDITWTQHTYENPSVFSGENTNIPEGAKYVVVFINSGLLEDGTEGINPMFIHYGGVEFTYEKKIAAAELTADGRFAVTYNADVENPALTVKLNGSEVPAEYIYDAQTYTSYIDVNVQNGDTLTVTVEGVGEITKTIEDEREQIESIVVLDSFGYEIEELPFDETNVTVKASVKNTDEDIINFYVGLYNGDELVQVEMVSAAVSERAASVEIPMAFDTPISDGNVLKVFCWKDNMEPLANYANYQDIFETGDF